jgi:hypothetical protein
MVRGDCMYCPTGSITHSWVLLINHDLKIIQESRWCRSIFEPNPQVVCLLHPLLEGTRLTIVIGVDAALCFFWLLNLCVVGSNSGPSDVPNPRRVARKTTSCGVLVTRIWNGDEQILVPLVLNENQFCGELAKRNATTRGCRQAGRETCLVHTRSLLL